MGLRKVAFGKNISRSVLGRSVLFMTGERPVES